MTNSGAPTIVHHFADRLQRDAARAALYIKRGNHFVSISWAELGQDVHRIACGLIHLGIRPGDRVAQLAENRYEWIVTDLAIQLVQAVHVPLHASLAAEQIQRQVEHSESRVLFVSDETQFAKLDRIEAQLPGDLPLIRYHGRRKSLGPRPVIDWSSWSKSGDVASLSRMIRTAQTEVAADSLATILYTSGTTGDPKGVMLSHGNLAFTALRTIQVKGLTAEDLRLSFLPLSHIYERTCGWYTTICAGAQLALAGGRASVLEDCAILRPTVMNGVPYFYEQVRRRLEQRKVDPQEGTLRQWFGGRIRSCSCGGAPLAESLYDFFNERGVPLLQGYGQTEASPVISTSSARENRRGAVGRPLPGTQVRIADDGEVLTRGPHVMLGYWRDAAATAHALRDGWLYTGDLGQIDEDGYLRITGRKTERIVLNVGKKVEPAYLEALLLTEPLIEQAMIVGEGRSYLTALIVPNVDQIREHVSIKRARSDPSEFLSQSAVRDLIRQRIDACLACVAHHEQVRDFLLLPRPLLAERGELTPKMSLRRAVILEHFGPQIDALYETPQEPRSRR